MRVFRVYRSTNDTSNRNATISYKQIWMCHQISVEAMAQAPIDSPFLNVCSDKETSGSYCSWQCFKPNALKPR